MMTCRKEISAGGGDKLTNLLAIEVVIAAQDKRLTCGHRRVIFEPFKQKKEKANRQRHATTSSSTTLINMLLKQIKLLQRE